MIRVLSLTVYTATKSNKLYYERFSDKYFTNNGYLTMWREDIEREYERIFNIPVKAYVIRRAKPEKNIDMMSVMMNTANVMGQNINDVLSDTRKREIVDVRKTTCMILLDADYTPPQIERQLPFKNRIIYDYRTKMENRFVTERGSEDKYEEIKAKVMSLINIEKDHKSQ